MSGDGEERSDGLLPSHIRSQAFPEWSPEYRCWIWGIPLRNITSETNMQQTETSLRNPRVKLVLRCRVSAAEEAVSFPNCCFQSQLELWRPFKWNISAYWACQVAWTYLFKRQQAVSCCFLFTARKSQCCRTTETVLSGAGRDGPKHIFTSPFYLDPLFFLHTASCLHFFCLEKGKCFKNVRSFLKHQAAERKFKSHLSRTFGWIKTLRFFPQHRWKRFSTFMKS